MKLKKLFMVFPAILLAFSVTGCGNDEVDTEVNRNSYEQIQGKLVNLETYQSEATVEYISNKGSNTYDTFQQCTADGKYRIEVTGPENVSGSVTLSDGQTIWQYNAKYSDKVAVSTKENAERSEIFLTSFIKNYLNSQEVSVSAGNFGEGNCTILEAIVPGNHPYLATEKLWVDNETLKPVKLVIYDPDGAERMVVTYKTFDYNIPLSDGLFSM